MERRLNRFLLSKRGAYRRGRLFERGANLREGLKRGSMVLKRNRTQRNHIDVAIISIDRKKYAPGLSLVIVFWSKTFRQ